ncbi:M949_RS01915 family surface polysaccharide biosynthesis protein [Aquimarina sp. AU474]|uniref:M949_RS01915 family surface polysaccharide biosynthesis protein n=1 Tax=Aquimarina sp. AU474 TaxID=2108529 RepID=UPI000D689794|nr:hypothetical protein [Aquimarina sp. AU474]
MKKFLLFITIIAVFSCKKQSNESKNNTDQETEKEEVTTIIDLNRQDSIEYDSAIVNKLSEKEISSTFTRRKKGQLGIDYPIYQAYSYKDQLGEYYLLLTDHFSETNEENDSLYNHIQALKISNKNKQLKKSSSIKDDIDEDWETSIGFWNAYSSLTDLDEDGIVDLLLVYGTKGQNDYVDGRVKIMLYHNKRRITIRHQNSDIKGGRLTKISSKFYALPEKIQNIIKDKMKLMIKNSHASFAEGWEDKMKNSATRIE